jgi:hypothetical protein
MTVYEAVQLSDGNRVQWSLVDPEGRGRMGGTVLQADGTGIKVRWDDGVAGVYLYDVPESAANLRFIVKEMS